MLYVVLTMPTLNKAYLFIYLFIYIQHWPKEKGQTTIYKNITHKTKHRVKRTPLKPHVSRKGKQFLLH
jgi:hypothetical protein